MPNKLKQGRGALKIKYNGEEEIFSISLEMRESL